MQSNYYCPPQPSAVDTVQDFLIKLGIKPLLHILEISIFSLNNDIVRLTKIMNKQPCQRFQNSKFQSLFSVSKIGWIFPRKNFCVEYLIRRPTFIDENFWKLWFLKYRTRAIITRGLYFFYPLSIFNRGL